MRALIHVPGVRAGRLQEALVGCERAICPMYTPTGVPKAGSEHLELVALVYIEGERAPRWINAMRLVEDVRIEIYAVGECGDNARRLVDIEPE